MSDNLSLGDSGVRSGICVSFFFCGIVYYFIQRRIPKWLKALLVIAAALWSNFYQLGKLAEEGARPMLYDRIIFIVVGIGVIGEGIKRLIDDLKPKTPAQSSTTPNS